MPELDVGDELQRIDGFGFCAGFQRAAVLRGLFGLPAGRQREVLDLLFHRERGAGASILRLTVGSAADGGYPSPRSIQPEDPGGPSAPPRYRWDGDDSGQLWLAKEAHGYGVRRFVAVAWSAPGYMKTNGTDRDGGHLRGPTGTAGPDDWRRAYADYLLRYVRCYADEGVEITDLGFTNEPELARPYASMEVTPAQALDIIGVLGPVLRRSAPGLTLTCCDSVSWPRQAVLSTAIEADPTARRYVGIHTGHQYDHEGEPGRADRPLPTRRPTWMTEWDPAVAGAPWNERWDRGGPTSGIALAENIHGALVAAGVSAYLYWFGASIAETQALIRLDGARYQVSKRLWALAAYSRFIRPGARRLRVPAVDDDLRVSAFRNADGSVVVELLNMAGTPARVRFTGSAVTGATVTGVFRTDEEHSLAPAVPVDGAAVPVAPRSLTTAVLTPVDR
jgi:glucuronoarabinoxylan endo-1,4-beta-xylanase